MKVAISSDNHIDLNHLDVAAVVYQQAAYLRAQAIDLYIVAGDLFNDFTKSLDFMHALQKEVGPETQVRFIAGNHDMGRGISFTELESPLDPLYLHNQFVDLPGTNWRIIANNGWYDYGFAPEVDLETITNFRQGFYFDRVIDQSISDRERMELVIEQTQSQLQQAALAQKQVLFATHFVPIADELFHPQHRRWQVINSIMGSPRLGKLMEETPFVKEVFYGHQHITVPERQHQQVHYHNVSVGYQRGKRREWTKDDFMQTWIDKTIIKVLT